jgi:uncharacterized protein involved in cysteine biosynthesis
MARSSHEDGTIALMRSRTRSLLRGVRLGGRGLRHALLSGAVLRTCWPLAVIGLALGLLLQILAAWGVLSLTRVPEDAAAWLVVSAWIVRVVGLVAGIVVASIAAILGTGLIVPLLGDRILLAALRPLDPGRAARLEASVGLGAGGQVIASLRRLLGFVAWSLLAFAVSFIPFAGVVLGPSLEAAIAARFLGWELLEPAFSRLGMSAASQRAFLASHRWELLGFALPFVPGLAVPLLGPALFALAQGAAAVLMHEELRDLDTPPAWTRAGPRR